MEAICGVNKEKPWRLHECIYTETFKSFSYLKSMCTTLIYGGLLVHVLKVLKVSSKLSIVFV